MYVFVTMSLGLNELDYAGGSEVRLEPSLNNALPHILGQKEVFDSNDEVPATKFLNDGQSYGEEESIGRKLIFIFFR